MSSSILLAGVDTLIVNVKLLDEKGTPAKEQAISDDLLGELEDLQRQAQDEKKPLASGYTFYGARLVMFPNGAPLWKYILRNDCIEVKLVPRLKLAAVAKVRLSSAYLWSRGGPRDAVKRVHG